MAAGELFLASIKTPSLYFSYSGEWNARGVGMYRALIKFIALGSGKGGLFHYPRHMQEEKVL